MGYLNELCLLICTLVTIVTSHATDYCTLSCKKDQHTMCKYKNPTPSHGCYHVERAGMSSVEIDQVVKKHNELRAKVAQGQEKRGISGPQPTAANLGPLTWDNELAQVAQRWANQCQFRHDTCRVVERFNVGQNIASASTSGPNNGDLSKMVQGWYDEVEYFDRNQVAKFTNIYNGGKAVGHYTQLIWADTKYVGCGTVRYQEPGWNTTYLVCNYGPAGNVLGRQIYKIR